MKKSPFKLKKTANTNNTHAAGWIKIPFKTLTRLFGKPHFYCVEEQGAEWHFADAKRKTGIALYQDIINNSKNTSYWNIGAKTFKAAQDFRAWILEQIA